MKAKSMKLKVNRRKAAEKRQELARQMVIWGAKIRDLKRKIALMPDSRSLSQLVLCEAEHAKSAEALRTLSTRQRRWASGVLGLKKVW